MHETILTQEEFFKIYSNGSVKHLDCVELEKHASNVIDRYSLNQQMDFSKKHLKNLYGVENLSTIEAWHLKRIVQTCLEETKNNWASHFKGEIGLAPLFWAPEEATERWLIEIYGIHTNTYCDKSYWPSHYLRKNMKMQLSQKARKKLLEDIAFTREQAHSPSLD